MVTETNSTSLSHTIVDENYEDEEERCLKCNRTFIPGTMRRDILEGCNTRLFSLDQPLKAKEDQLSEIGKGEWEEIVSSLVRHLFKDIGFATQERITAYFSDAETIKDILNYFSYSERTTPHDFERALGINFLSNRNSEDAGRENVQQLLLTFLPLTTISMEDGVETSFYQTLNVHCLSKRQKACFDTIYPLFNYKLSTKSVVDELLVLGHMPVGGKPFKRIPLGSQMALEGMKYLNSTVDYYCARMLPYWKMINPHVDWQQITYLSKLAVLSAATIRRLIVVTGSKLLPNIFKSKADSLQYQDKTDDMKWANLFFTALATSKVRYGKDWYQLDIWTNRLVAIIVSRFVKIYREVMAVSPSA